MNIDNNRMRDAMANRAGLPVDVERPAWKAMLGEIVGAIAAIAMFAAAAIIALAASPSQMGAEGDLYDADCRTAGVAQ